MSQEPRDTAYVPTLLRLDKEARDMLDDYRAAVGGTLHAAAAAMIAGFYADWHADCERADARGSLAGSGYGPFAGRAS